MNHLPTLIVHLCMLLIAGNLPLAAQENAQNEAAEEQAEPKKEPFFKRMMRTVTTLGQSEEDEIRGRQQQPAETETQQDKPAATPAKKFNPPPASAPKSKPEPAPKPKATPKPTPEPTPAPAPVADTPPEPEKKDSSDVLSETPEFIPETEPAAEPQEAASEPQQTPRELYREMRAEALADEELIELQQAIYAATSEADHYQASKKFYAALFAKLKQEESPISSYIDLMEQAAERKLEQQRDRMKSVFKQRQALLDEASNTQADNTQEAGDS